MTEKTVDRTAAGQAMENLFIETTYTFFLLREGGKQIGTIRSSGSCWGMLNSLKQEGPQTVPQIARSRPVSRQGIQKLANEMIEEGSIELIDNPAHKKSKLLRITAKGEALFQDLTERNAQAAELLAQDMDAVELEIAVKVMRQLRDKLKKSILI
jgi:DNA-binding MarR family transcriptional regulator